MANVTHRRRLKVVYVTSHTIVDILRWHTAPDGASLQIEKLNLPDGVEVVHVNWAVERAAWAVALHHPDWPPVPDGDMIPVIVGPYQLIRSPGPAATWGTAADWLNDQGHDDAAAALRVYLGLEEPPPKMRYECCASYTVTTKGPRVCGAPVEPGQKYCDAHHCYDCDSQATRQCPVCHVHSCEECDGCECVNRG